MSFRFGSDRGGGYDERLRSNLPTLPEMTIMTIMTFSPKSRLRDDSWTVAEAKAKFSEVLDRAETQGPQTVTRNGRRAAVVVATQEWERKTKRTGNLSEFLAGSPLRRSKLKVERRRDRPRKIDL